VLPRRPRPSLSHESSGWPERKRTPAAKSSRRNRIAVLASVHATTPTNASSGRPATVPIVRITRHGLRRAVTSLNHASKGRQAKMPQRPSWWNATSIRRPAM
jgi:hypothetical protein